MLKIMVLADNISVSAFPIIYKGNYTGTIGKLPQKLSARVAEAMEVLRDEDVTEVMYGEFGIIVTSHKVNHGGSGVCGQSITETIELLDWYFIPHLSARDPDRIGGSLVCSDCHQSQPQAVSSDGFCKNPLCSSHAKWAEIIEGYVPPANKLAKVLTCLSLAHHQNESSGGAVDEQKKLVEAAFKGIPRTGSQNEWVEKANTWAEKG